MQHNYQDLIEIFEQTFFERYNTKLVKGDDEPIYLPATAERECNQIVFARGYFSSALHEVAHWCIAGEERRKLEDFGYWYQPDGRSLQQQAAFEAVEIKPQAIEWAFSVAANKPFNVSADNLNGEGADTVSFRLKVYEQVKLYLKQGFPIRAQQFIDALTRFYSTSEQLEQSLFTLDEELYTNV